MMDLDLLLTHINAVNIHAGHLDPSSIVVNATSSSGPSRDNGHCGGHRRTNNNNDVGNNNNDDDEVGDVDNSAFTAVNERPKQLPIAHLPPQPPPRSGDGPRQVRSPAHSPTSANPASCTLTFASHRQGRIGSGGGGVTLHPGSTHRVVNHQHVHSHHLTHQQQQQQQLLQLPQLPTQYAAPLLYHMQQSHHGVIGDPTPSTAGVVGESLFATVCFSPQSNQSCMHQNIKLSWRTGSGWLPGMRHAPGPDMSSDCIISHDAPACTLGLYPDIVFNKLYLRCERRGWGCKKRILIETGMALCSTRVRVLRYAVNTPPPLHGAVSLPPTPYILLDLAVREIWLSTEPFSGIVPNKADMTSVNVGATTGEWRHVLGWVGRHRTWILTVTLKHGVRLDDLKGSQLRVSDDTSILVSRWDGSSIKRHSSYHGPNSLANKFRHNKAVRRPSGSFTYVRNVVDLIAELLLRKDGRGNCPGPPPSPDDV
ncbi:hypothetical protein Btru_057884 [Bulinus truncatus]|nr:hypothetical protein Btru_057884 [Bulinus truncatus]